MRNRFYRNAYAGIPPREEEIVYYYYPFIAYPQPEPNYALDDQMITQIAYRILTNILMYKPKSEVEISPITRVRINI
jgi:hypothetical protein